LGLFISGIVRWLCLGYAFAGASNRIQVIRFGADAETLVFDVGGCAETGKLFDRPMSVDIAGIAALLIACTTFRTGIAPFFIRIELVYLSF
jgi:hypothetical protein